MIGKNLNKHQNDKYIFKLRLIFAIIFYKGEGKHSEECVSPDGN